MDKRHNLRILGLTMFTLAGLSLAHSVDKKEAADATVQAGQDLKGNPQMTMPVTKAEKDKEMKAEKKAEVKAEKKAEKAKKAEAKKEMKAEKKVEKAKKAEVKKEMKAEKKAKKAEVKPVEAKTM